jgi:hypothetical protein
MYFNSYFALVCRVLPRTEDPRPQLCALPSPSRCKTGGSRGFLIRLDWLWLRLWVSVGVMGGSNMIMSCALRIIVALHSCASWSHFPPPLLSNSLTNAFTHIPHSLSRSLSRSVSKSRYQFHNSSREVERARHNLRRYVTVFYLFSILMRCNEMK